MRNPNSEQVNPDRAPAACPDGAATQAGGARAPAPGGRPAGAAATGAAAASGAAVASGTAVVPGAAAAPAVVAGAALAAVDGALAQAFGRYTVDPGCPGGDPLFRVIKIILNHRSTHVHVRQALDALARACPDWDAVARAHPDVLADCIRPAGLARQKAGHIRAVLERVHEDTGAYSLDFLRDWDTARANAYLQGLTGVGAHTAALVLMFALRRPGVMPVDGHAHRVVRRLGWAAPRATPLAVQRAVEQAAGPAMDLTDLHVNLIRLGSRHCRPVGPDCPQCPVSDHCASARLMPFLT